MKGTAQVMKGRINEAVRGKHKETESSSKREELFQKLTEELARHLKTGGKNFYPPLIAKEVRNDEKAKG